MHNEDDNLRIATQKVNAENRRLNRNNTSGIAGVCEFKPGGILRGYHVIWKDAQRKTRGQRFAISSFANREAAFAAAVAYRYKKEDELGIETRRRTMKLKTEFDDVEVPVERSKQIMENKLLIIKHWNAGNRSATEVARLTGISVRIVNHCHEQLKATGEIRMHRRRTEPEVLHQQRLAVIEAFQKGLSVPEATASSGALLASVRTWYKLLQAGKSIFPASRKRARDTEPLPSDPEEPPMKKQRGDPELTDSLIL